MSLWAVLLTGLFAGGVSCAAVQGGLLAGVVARRRHSPATVARSGPPPAASTAQRRPHLEPPLPEPLMTQPS